MPQFRLTNTSGTQMQFVDPTDYRHLLTVTWSHSDKQQLGVPGKTLRNSKWTLKNNRQVLAPAVVGCDPCSIGRENIKIETTVSGSIENEQKLVAELKLHAHNLLILASSLAVGFPPALAIELPTELPAG